MSEIGRDPEIELGEAQWAVPLDGRAVAHWMALDLRRPEQAIASCGLAFPISPIFHPGRYPLCPACRRRHDPPNDGLSSSGVLRWLQAEEGPPDRMRS